MPKVSLTKPGTGSTQWGTNVGQNWTDIENTFKQAMYQREVFEFCHEFLLPPGRAADGGWLTEFDGASAPASRPSGPSCAV